MARINADFQTRKTRNSKRPILSDWALLILEFA